MTTVDTELLLVALGAMLAPVTLFLSVLALVVGERPMRTGLWFYLGAFGITVIVGVVAAFVLGNSAASPRPSTPKTWVAIVDVVAGVAVLGVVVRFLRRPRDPSRVTRMIARMSHVASSPVIAIVAAGATLANPGALIPIALKDISETNPSTGAIIAGGSASRSSRCCRSHWRSSCSHWHPRPRCGRYIEPASCSRRTHGRSRPGS